MSTAVHGAEPPRIRVWSTIWSRSPLAWALIGLLIAYRTLISPLYGQVCRYHPTCSAYALGAVRSHGALRGSWYAARRVLRCHPWAPGGYDPVPPARTTRTSAATTPNTNSPQGG